MQIFFLNLILVLNKSFFLEWYAHTETTMGGGGEGREWGRVWEIERGRGGGGWKLKQKLFRRFSASNINIDEKYEQSKSESVENAQAIISNGMVCNVI